VAPLQVYSSFDWTKYILTLHGPRPIGTPAHDRPAGACRTPLSSLVDQFRLKDDVQPVCWRGAFQRRCCNIEDPLNPHNNLGYSLNHQTLQYVQHALAEGRKHLDYLLSCAYVAITLPPVVPVVELDRGRWKGAPSHGPGPGPGPGPGGIKGPPREGCLVVDVSPYNWDRHSVSSEGSDGNQSDGSDNGRGAPPSPPLTSGSGSGAPRPGMYPPKGGGPWPQPPPAALPPPSPAAWSHPHPYHVAAPLAHPYAYQHMGSPPRGVGRTPQPPPPREPGVPFSVAYFPRLHQLYMNPGVRRADLLNHPCESRASMLVCDDQIPSSPRHHASLLNSLLDGDITSFYNSLAAVASRARVAAPRACPPPPGGDGNSPMVRAGHETPLSEGPDTLSPQTAPATLSSPSSLSSDSPPPLELDKEATPTSAFCREGDGDGDPEPSASPPRAACFDPPGCDPAASVASDHGDHPPPTGHAQTEPPEADASSPDAAPAEMRDGPLEAQDVPHARPDAEPPAGGESDGEVATSQPDPPPSEAEEGVMVPPSGTATGEEVGQLDIGKVGEGGQSGGEPEPEPEPDPLPSVEERSCPKEAEPEAPPPERPVAWSQGKDRRGKHGQQGKQRKRKNAAVDAKPRGTTPPPPRLVDKGVQTPGPEEGVPGRRPWARFARVVAMLGGLIMFLVTGLSASRYLVLPRTPQTPPHAPPEQAQPPAPEVVTAEEPGAGPGGAVGAGAAAAAAAAAGEAPSHLAHWIAVGGQLSLGGPAEGVGPQAHFRWFKDGRPLDAEGAAASSWYVIESATPEDEGEYTCVSYEGPDDREGRLWGRTTVRISQPPVLLKRPRSQTLLQPGALLALTVKAQAVPAPQFQWRLNGVPIPGATADTYSVARVDASHAGTYTCQVRNMAGSVLWEEAVIALAPAGQ
jgi:hypothetical protein